MKKVLLLFILFLANQAYSQQIDLPVTFDEMGIDYTLTDFGDNFSSLIADPVNGANTVASTTKPMIAPLWAGTTIGTADGFANPIPFTTFSTKMTVMVYSPDANIPVRLKVEDATDPAISVETEAMTTTSNAWEMLTFDFNNPVMGTAALNLDNTYDKASIFFNFGTDGATAGEKTYLWDDVQFVDEEPTDQPVDLPITFDEATVNYALTDFGGNMSQVVVDPTDPMNNVAMSVKTDVAELWAGTTMSTDTGLVSAIPFTAISTTMTVMVYSPDANIPVRLKVEDKNDAAISVETEAMTTVANEWEMLTFDFNNPVMGTAALNLDNTYNKASIFFNFGTDGATAGEKTYYWDNVQFVESQFDQVNLPITFEADNIDYALVDFGGNGSEIVEDPTDPMNTVVRTTKPEGAELWAGTTAGNNGLAEPIPFTATSTVLTVRVWSPDAGIPIRLKVEDANDPAISVETETLTTVASEWETLSFDFTNPVAGTAAINFDNVYQKVSVFFNFGTDGNTAGEKTYYWDDVEFVESSLEQINLPVTFEEDNVDYSLTDFGGNISEIVEDPTDPMNTVAQSTKPEGAELWAGTTAGAAGFVDAIPFAPNSTVMTVRVWSPDAGIPIRLKVEDANDPTISVETETMTTVASEWETLSFDFSNEVAGTAAINFDNVYKKASIFFNFGTDGNTAGEKTYYWDDIEFDADALGQINLPVTFEEDNVDFDLTDFGGNMSQVVEDPTDPMNTVAQSVKGDMAELWAGTTMGNNGFQDPIPFNAISSQMTVRVWSPDAGIPVRLKVENALDPAISVETEALTTVANEWEMLTFDFTDEVDGTAALDLANTYDKASIFFNFGTDGATAGEKTYYWDDVQFIFNALNQIDLPVTFEEDNVDFSLTDFGGNASEIVEDPVDPMNTVGKSIKTDAAELWAGTTIGTDAGFANVIPFELGQTKMTVDVYSPDAGIPIRLKVEDAGDPTISVETEATTTVANEWETLTFDFSNEVMGTAAINFDNTYDKASIFFNFGTDGATAGEKTYHWDNVQFVVNNLAQIDLPVTFEEDNVDYSVIDFGGNNTVLDIDPTDPMNTVAQSTKLGDAEVWAGTTIGTEAGFANAIPFTEDMTTMSVSVYSPDEGTPIRLKVEDATDPNISVETEVLTSVANAWEVLVFDFTNEVDGTAALDLNQTYDKASIFFNFGTDGATAGEKMYYWDNVEFGGIIDNVFQTETLDLNYFPNPVRNNLQINAVETIERVSIVNLLGQEIANYEINADNASIDVSKLNAGTYFVKVRGAEKINSFTIVKQ